MTDLYAILGLERDATPADITAAYRRRAKTLHPDAGGSRKAFEELNQAKTVLLDRALRARYDATGEIGSGSAISNELAETATMLTMVFEAAIGSVADENQAARFDLVRSMGLILNAETENRSRRRVQLQAQKRRLSAIAKRLGMKKIKKGQPPKANFLLNHVSGKIAPLDAELAQLDKFDAISKRASEMLEDYVYAFEQPKPEMVTLTPNFSVQGMWKRTE